MENEVKNVTPPTVTVTPTATQPSFISTVAGGAWRGASSFVGLASRFTPRPRFKVEETICYSVHPSFYLWPLIIFGWIIGALIHYNPSHALGYSWMYIWILFYTTMMLMFDIGAIKLVVASAFLGLIIVSAKYSIRAYLQAFSAFAAYYELWSACGVELDVLYPLVDYGY
jgi:hypothetical protein